MTVIGTGGSSLDAGVQAYFADARAVRNGRLASVAVLTAFLGVSVSPTYFLTFGAPQFLLQALYYLIGGRVAAGSDPRAGARAIPFLTAIQILIAAHVCGTGLELRFVHHLRAESTLLIVASLVLSALKSQPTRLIYGLTLAPPVIAMAVLTFMRPLEEARTAAAMLLLFVSIMATAMRQQKLNRAAVRLRVESDATALRLAQLLASAEIAETVAMMGHWRLSDEGRRQTWSPGVFEIFGLPPADAPPEYETVIAAYVEEDRPRVEQAVNDALTLRQGFDFEHRIRRLSDGEERRLLVKAHYSEDDGGCLIGVVQDVTEARRIEQQHIDSEARYRLLADNAGDIIVQSDLHGRVSYVSPACLAVTGYAVDELVGRRAIDFMPVEDAEQMRRVAKEVYAEESDDTRMVEYRFRHKDGSLRWLEAHPRFVRDPVTGERNALIDVVRNADARKALEAELVAARVEAEAGASAKADFLANMSHELRTPLNSIVGFSSLVADAPELEPETRRRARMTRDASKALVAIVNDVLDLSKLEAEGVNLSPEPVDLAHLLTDVVDLVRDEAVAKGLTLTLQTPPETMRVLVDPTRLRQIALNLLGNAIKFTAKGGVTLSLSRDSRDRVRIAVRDTGIGIAGDRLQAVFGRFAQADGSTGRRFGGTGLGLTICRSLVEAMGGTIDVHSVEGAGSTFTVVIDPPTVEDCFDSLQADAPVSIPARLREHRPRILLADDNAMNRDLFTALLSGEALDITCVEDGAQAVRAVQEQRFDVIFMDVQMPVMNGLEAVRAMRSLGLDTPVVALTANVMPASVAKARQAGMSDHLGKPYSARDLLEAVARWADHAAPAQEAEVVSSDVLTRLGRALGPDRLQHFLAGLREQLQETLVLLRDPAADAAVLIRRAHSVRGYAGSLGYIDIARAYGALEEGLTAGRPADAPLAQAVAATHAALADIDGRRAAAA